MPVFSQDDASLFGGFRSEQKKFIEQVRSVPGDTSIVYPIARSVDSEISGLYRSLGRDRKLGTRQKEKAIKSLVYFMTDLGRRLQQQDFEVYDVPAAFESYRNILVALNRNESLAPQLAALDPKKLQIMAEAFGEYEVRDYLDDVAVYKRVASSPEYILRFLESKPGFRFRDSLLLVLAMHEPMKLVSYLNKKYTVLQPMIRASGNAYIRQIVSLSDNKSASELLPFIPQVMEGSLSTADIMDTRTRVQDYYQMLVNSLVEANRAGAGKGRKPLRNGLRQKSISFYVNPVNELHDASDPVRFASVKQLRPEDIYYIITSAGEELYTSSYLGLYKRLKSHFTRNNADSIFDIVGFDDFHVFIRLAANYNVLADFLHSMPGEKAKEILNRFIDGIGNDDATALDRAMDIADSFGALAGSPDLVQYAGDELRKNLELSRSKNQYRGMRLYDILLQLIELVKVDGSLSSLWKKLGNYEELERQSLRNERGNIVELVLFYGDEDGVASYQNFMRSYFDSSRWKVEKNPYWVTIRSVSEEPLVIYANLPLDISKELDRAAQDSLFEYLRLHEIEPSIMVHRGHSYHLDKTLNRLKPSVKLAVLGSCGGYNKALSIANINPDVHVIGSKKTGSKIINDPLLDVINKSLVDQQDLQWPVVWKQLSERFSRDPGTLSLFNEYFPPGSNMSLFVLKLFRSAGSGVMN